jgi:hypothetical protein
MTTMVSHNPQSGDAPFAQKALHGVENFVDQEFGEIKKDLKQTAMQLRNAVIAFVLGSTLLSTSVVTGVVGAMMGSSEQTRIAYAAALVTAFGAMVCFVVGLLARPRHVWRQL